MRKYKVKFSSHTDSAGKTYTAGQVVTTSQDLMKDYPEKFEDLGPAITETAPAAAPKLVPPPNTTAQNPLKKKKAE
jgi:hypothetical protein